jgi:hypothetical protein
MSIGNTKDYGNKGNNFPWQYKMLLGLDKILAAISGSPGSFLAPQTRVPHYELSTSTGATLAGVYSFSIANVGSANGTIAGSNILPGITVNFDAGALNNTLNSINYDATGTTFVITYIS